MLVNPLIPPVDGVKHFDRSLGDLLGRGGHGRPVAVILVPVVVVGRWSWSCSSWPWGSIPVSGITAGINEGLFGARVPWFLQCT